MKTDISSASHIFSELLNLNPWAAPFWEKRNELIGAGVWNMQFRNQAGNKICSEWLGQFKRARRAATRSRLVGPKSAWDDWSLEVRKLMLPYQERSDFPLYRIGSEVSSNGMPAYNVGSFWADAHLLMDADLSEEEFCEDLDISGYVFPSSLHAVNIKVLGNINAQAAKFGDHTSFAMSVFKGTADFGHVRFGAWNGFVGTKFLSDAVFENARFGFEGSFTAVAFQGLANFNNVVFEGTAPFCGTNFRRTPNFSNARFMGVTEFSDATFSAGAIFDDAWFPDKVFVHRVSEDVVEVIRKADHSSSRPEH